MRKLLRSTTMLIVAAVFMGFADRSNAFTLIELMLLDTGGLPGGRVLGVHDDGELYVVGVVNDGSRDHPALWLGRRGGAPRLVRLSEPPGGGGSANAAIIVGTGAQRRVLVVGYMDDPTRDNMAALWIVNPRTGDQNVRMLGGPGTEARGIVADRFSLGGDNGSLVVGTRHSGGTHRAILWNVPDNGNVVAMALPDEGAGAEADAITDNDGIPILRVGGCLVDQPTGEEVGCVWQGDPVNGFTVRRLPVDDGPNHFYGMSPMGNYAVGVQFPVGAPRWPGAWGRSPSGDWQTIELNNQVNWNGGYSAALNGVNSRGMAGGYAGGYADGLTRGFLLDISNPPDEQRAFMAIDAVDPDRRRGIQITHVAGVAENGLIGGWAETPGSPGVAQPFVGIPDNRFHKTCLLYGSMGGYGGTPEEVFSWWDDGWAVTRSSMPGADCAILRGRVKSIWHTYRGEPVIRITSRLQGGHGDRVRQELCLWNHQYMRWDMIAADPIRGGNFQENRYRIDSAVAGQYISDSTGVWYQFEWIDVAGRFPNGFSVDTDSVTIVLR